MGSASPVFGGQSVSKLSQSYAGDISADQAWSALASDASARLIDVRTYAEWTFVGLPDLGRLGRDVLCVELQSFPAMAPNPGFLAQSIAALERSGAQKSSPIFCLCRSGARSRAAAIALTEAGYSKVYNISGGFEGDLDQDRHRGQLNGWRRSGLPWRQT